MIQRQLELATPAAIAAALGLGREPETHLPQQLAPGEPEPITTADPHECLDRRSFESGRSASDEIADALEWSVALSLSNGRSRRLFTPMTHEAKPYTQRPVFNRAPDIAAIEVRQFHVDAMAQCVATQGVDRVKTHRLIVEERDVVLDGMIVPEPRRLIGEQSKRRGVRFGKSKFTEGDHLGEHFF